MEDGRTEDNVLDVLIVGGGPAGMSAALYLGRGRKRVLVVDDDNARHRVSDGVHNFLTREGIAPAALRTVAWEQLGTFPNLSRRQGRVERLRPRDGGWEAEVGGDRLFARTGLVAVGVVDQHPAIEGYEEKWAKSIHHCPYCHGWEMRDQPLAVLASGEAAAHLAPLLRGWSQDVVLLTHGETLDDETEAMLTSREIPVRHERVVALRGPGSELESIHFESGEPLPRTGLFVAAEQRPTPLVAGLEATLEGPYLDVDPEQRTSLPRLWAAGDCTTRFQQVIEAANQGARAAASINAELTLGPHG
ncbi:MAG: NAD(P)/FAD-dependent oxidoreductase [Myxococcota bacterium]